MDYMRFVQHHVDTNADITIGCIPYEESRASDFGLMKIDGEVGLGTLGMGHGAWAWGMGASAV
jgi:ADP-glucose pyrophosphorylase